MGQRIIHNKRPHDHNIQRNYATNQTEVQEFVLPSDLIRTLEERDALVSALEVFVKVTEAGLRLPGRSFTEDHQRLPLMRRLLGKF